jgi:hypothetical protein
MESCVETYFSIDSLVKQESIHCDSIMWCAPVLSGLSWWVLFLPIKWREKPDSPKQIQMSPVLPHNTDINFIISRSLELL